MDDLETKGYGADLSGNRNSMLMAKVIEDLGPEQFAFLMIKIFVYLPDLRIPQFEAGEGFFCQREIPGNALVVPAREKMKILHECRFFP